ncbi:hypothetical protein ACUOBA_49110, partial [Escherichia coli]
PRSVDLLFSQLNKLVDVAHVAICQSRRGNHDDASGFTTIFRQINPGWQK